MLRNLFSVKSGKVECFRLLDFQVMYCLEQLHQEIIISVYLKDGSANTGRLAGLLFFL
jgi:hypothetical protein